MARKRSNRKQFPWLFFGVASIVILFVATVFTVAFSMREQIDNSRATAATTLFFSPDSTAAMPLSYTANQAGALDVMVNPGTNAVSSVKLDIQYDPTKIALNATTPFVVNTTAFPTILEGPIYSPGRVQVVLSIGADQTQAITQQAKLGTIYFTTIADTGAGQTTVTFGSQNEVSSLASTDLSGENVLAATQPAFLVIQSSVPSSTPSPFPTATPTPVVIDTIPPTISFTSPVSGSRIKRGSTVVISASATDNVGVTQVVFSENGTDLCTDTTHPYSCVWTLPGKPNATYTLQATAFDAAGNSAVTSLKISSMK